MKLKQYFSIIYWGRAIYLIEAFLGFLVLHYLNDTISIKQLGTLVVYLIFFQLGYYVIYIFNDLIDYEKDKNDPTASYRKPLVNKKITKAQAYKVACVLLTLGTLGTWYFGGIKGALIYQFAVYFNLLYSVLFKHLSVSIRNFTNALLHELRFLIPFILFTNLDFILNHWYLLAFYIFIPSYMVVFRRKIDNIPVSRWYMYWVRSGLTIFYVLVITHYKDVFIIALATLAVIIFVLYEVFEQKIIYYGKQALLKSKLL